MTQFYMYRQGKLNDVSFASLGMTHTACEFGIYPMFVNETAEKFSEGNFSYAYFGLYVGYMY